VMSKVTNAKMNVALYVGKRGQKFRWWNGGKEDRQWILWYPTMPKWGAATRPPKDHIRYGFAKL
jgi:hypothetical protein